jgi:hypothetical protein
MLLKIASIIGDFARLLLTDTTWGYLYDPSKKGILENYDFKK